MPTLYPLITVRLQENYCKSSQLNRKWKPFRHKDESDNKESKQCTQTTGDIIGKHRRNKPNQNTCRRNERDNPQINKLLTHQYQQPKVKGNWDD